MPLSSTRAAALLASTLAAGSAWAQPTTTEQGAADMTLARELGNDGLKLAGAGDCAAAVEPLSRSESMHHAPTTLAVLGECHVALGKLVEGAEELTRVVREKLDAQAPPSFGVAQERARASLDATLPRIPKLRLVVHGAARDAVLKLRVDGESIPAASVGLDRPIDPGSHHVEATARGYKPAKGDVTLHEGEIQSLTLELVALPPSEIPPENGAEGGPSGAWTGGATYSAPSRAPAYVLFGIGAAGVAAGVTFGLITLSKTSSLDKQCPTRATCPSSVQSDIDLSKTTAWTSNIAFGVGAAAIVAGLYFALRGHRTDSAASVRLGSSGVTWQPRIGLGSGGFEGTF